PASTDCELKPTVGELRTRVDLNDWVFILDVRTQEEFQICRIPGSTLLPLPELPQRFRKLNQDHEMVIHCKSGMRSLKATNFLRQQGFRKVKNLKGGILAWATSIDPTMPKY